MGEPNAFSSGSGPWLARLANLRNVVRQEMVTRQLAAHLPAPNAHVLDVGAGQGTQAIRLAQSGFDVMAVEPDDAMRAALGAAVVDEPPDVRSRISVRDGSLAELERVTDGIEFDAVLCHGVLMYLDSSAAAVGELSARVRPRGFVSLLTRNGDAMAWRPALRRDWTRALAALDESEQAGRGGGSAHYVNELGVRARADTCDGLARLLADSGLSLEAWYGVRVATDGVPVTEPLPDDPAERSALFDVEERLGRTDPYRRVGTLMRIIGRRHLAPPVSSVR